MNKGAKMILSLLGVVLLVGTMTGGYFYSKASGVIERDIPIVDAPEENSVVIQEAKPVLQDLSPEEAMKMEQEEAMAELLGENLFFSTDKESGKVVNQLDKMQQLAQEKAEKKKAAEEKKKEQENAQFQGGVSTSIFRKSPINGNVMNVLVIGTTASSGTHTVIGSYNQSNGKAYAHTVATNMFVPIPGHGWDRLSTAYSLGGTAGTINTLNSVLDLDIQGYVIFRFDTIASAVDQIGGITLSLSEQEAQFINKYAGTSMAAGSNKLSGSQALIHARNNDGGKSMFRHKQVGSALYHYGKNNGNLTSIANRILGGVKTNVSLNTLMNIGLSVAENQNITRGHIPVGGSTQHKQLDGKSVLEVDFEKNKQYIHGRLYP